MFRYNMKEYLSLQRIGVEPPRAYYVPFASTDKPKYKFGIIDRNSSSRFILLDGVWQIAQKNCSNELDVNEALTQTIPVPSCTQMHGYDQIQYINARYPFPFNPPYVPHNNPCWHYRRAFTLNKTDGFKYYLNFEGVDSAFYLYVNGAFKGYSQVSHSTSEFDITALVNDGINTLDVFVLKWCVSSYLECQDKFRFSGIFRSVYILARPAKHIVDYKIETIFDGDIGVFVFRNESPTDIIVNIGGYSVFCQKRQAVSLQIPNVIKWTAENPYLYDCTLFADDEVIYEKVGFIQSKVQNGIFTINGEAVKLKGVNRHEFNPETGATITLKGIETDLKLIKSLNCNAVRTSHYPNIPQFYQMCDAFGLYVMDEADLETHGVVQTEGGYDIKLWQKFAEDEFWTDGIFDRHRLLVERDKNRCCVVIWSLGNESSFGKAFLKGAKYIRKRDSRPIHYEGLQNAAKKYYYTNIVDMVSVMYPQYDFITDKYLTDARESRPLVLCEYSHAMGNSCGDIADYWKLIYNNPRLMGGFVWEWADHAIKTKQGFKYGGDFDEAQHDGNFCVDGLVTADRKLKSGALEMKAVYDGKLQSDKCNPLPVKLINYGKNIDVSVNEDNGEISVYDKCGNLLTTEPISINIMRAYTDNDAYGTAKSQWIKYGVDICKPVVRSVMHNDGVTVLQGSMQANCLSPLLDFTLQVSLCGNELNVGLSYSIAPNVPSVPRVGFKFAVNDRYNKFEYFGYGSGESYVDKLLACEYGHYQSTAEQSVQPYVRPQETGSHYGSTYLNIVNFAEVTAEKSFSFSVLPYSVKHMIESKHNYELKRNGNVYVCLDVAMRGVGSNSCGPELQQKYAVPRSASRNFKLTF